jgi:hypothetical protein
MPTSRYYDFDSSYLDSQISNHLTRSNKSRCLPVLNCFTMGRKAAIDVLISIKPMGSSVIRRWGVASLEEQTHLFQRFKLTTADCFSAAKSFEKR